MLFYCPARTNRGVVRTTGNLCQCTRGSADRIRINARGERTSRAGHQPIAPAERIMLDMRSEVVFRYWENVHYQHRANLYDETEFSKHLATMREVIVNRDRQIAAYWCGNRQFFSDPFRVELDAALAANLCASFALPAARAFPSAPTAQPPRTCTSSCVRARSREIRCRRLGRGSATFP